MKRIKLWASIFIVVISLISTLIAVGALTPASAWVLVGIIVIAAIFFAVKLVEVAVLPMQHQKQGEQTGQGLQSIATLTATGRNAVEGRLTNMEIARKSTSHAIGSKHSAPVFRMGFNSVNSVLQRFLPTADDLLSWESKPVIEGQQQHYCLTPAWELQEPWYIKVRRLNDDETELSFWNLDDNQLWFRSDDALADYPYRLDASQEKLIKYLLDQLASDERSAASAEASRTAPAIGDADEWSKPWERIPDRGWDRQAIELWHQGYTCGEIASKIDRVEKTVRNRITDLRNTYGEAIVPVRRGRDKELG